MKIVKYFVLLLLLVLVSLTVFIATKNGDYQFSKSKEIDLPKHTLFSYVSEYKNWPDWYADLPENAKIQMDSVSKDHLSGFTYNKWKVKTISSQPNDSISQSIQENSEMIQSKFIFRSENNKTLITWQVKGTMDFWTKVRAFFGGGAEEILGAKYEKSLNNINHYLTKEIANYSIESNNIVSIPETYYIKQDVVSKIDELGSRIFQSMQSMRIFIKDNNLTTNGSPFTIFESVDMSTGDVRYAVCQPIKEEIFTSEHSDIISGKVESFYGYKTILRGDYMHSDKAWEENRSAIAKYKLTENKTLKPISIYKKSILDSNRPSEWVTEIITPVIESYVLPESSVDSLSVN